MPYANGPKNSELDDVGKAKRIEAADIVNRELDHSEGRVHHSNLHRHLGVGAVQSAVSPPFPLALLEWSAGPPAEMRGKP